MRALLRKELRSALPFMALVLFFGSLNWAFLFLTEFPEQYPLSKVLTDENRVNTQLASFVVAIAFALGLLVRERDEGTLAFLDGLPVSRARIFFCKVAVAISVLWMLPLADFLFNVTVQLLSRTSLNREMHWELLLMVAGLDAMSCAVYLALGLALSFLRRFALLALGLLLWAWIVLQLMENPLAPLLDIFSLGQPVFQGQRWLLPWPKLGAQFILALVCVGIAFAAFQYAGDTAQRLASRLARGRSNAWLAGGTAVLIAAVWLGLTVYWATQSEDESGPRVHYATWATVRARTDRYQFLYPEDQSGSAGHLLGRADAVEAKVRQFLEAPAVGVITVDLMGEDPRHAGLAYWKKVQMNLPAELTTNEVDELLAVLGHETTHVYIDHLSESRLSQTFNSTRFFHEGLASYVEYHLFLPPQKLTPLRRLAAVSRARDEVKIEELFDDVQLTRNRDRDLVYPLGEVFVAALTRRHGDRAPGKVLRAFARPDAPKDLAGFALWQDTFQACGYNLAEVTDEFFAELDRAVAAHRAFIDALPRLRGAVEQDGGRIRVRASFEGSLPGRIVCRFRPRADTEDRFYEMRFARKDHTCEVRSAGYPDRSFWYQLGWWLGNDTAQIIYGPWIEVLRRP